MGRRVFGEAWRGCQRGPVGLFECVGLPGANRRKAGAGATPAKEVIMAKSQKKSNKEIRKPKAEKAKTIAANPSGKDQPVQMLTIKR